MTVVETLRSNELDPRMTARALRVDSDYVDADIIDEVGFVLRAGEILGVVGESGSGKTTAAMALLGVTREGATITAGSVTIAGTDLLGVEERERRGLRGRVISFIPQDPSTALSPTMRIGEQIAEIVSAHFPGASDQDERVEAALRSAQLPTDKQFRRRYPHELSGGQQQRVTIAMALVCRPGVIVMDEPTTGLDVTTQSRLLQEVADLAKRSRTAIVYVSHNLGVIRTLADRVAVMYAGRIIELADVETLFTSPRHPYTRRLLEAIPRLDGGAPRGLAGVAVEPWNRPAGCPFAPRCEFRMQVCEARPSLEPFEASLVSCWRAEEVSQTAPPPAASAATVAQRNGTTARSELLLEVRELSASYPARARLTSSASVVLSEVDLAVARGTCLGILGESGSGKTTLLRTLAGLHPPHAGEIRFDGTTLASEPRRRTSRQRRSIQLVPQNPDGTLNPRHTVGQIVARPLRQFLGLTRDEQRKRVLELLEQVRLRPGMVTRYPRELSGGEKQRVAVARGLASSPTLLLCDEVTSALDVVVQAGVLQLLAELQRELQMTMIFVSHDLAVIRSVSDHVAVMQDGRIRETQPVEQLFANPRDDYTRALIDAVPMLRDSDYPRAAPARAAAGR